jgi:hypothetical protein
MVIEEHYDKRSLSYESTFDMLYFEVFDNVGEHFFYALCINL